MNRIRAKITKITKSGAVALVKFESLKSSANPNGDLANQTRANPANKNAESTANPAIFSAVLLDFADNLAQGNECNVIFKESEVMIAALDSRVSARNCFLSRIVKIECDEIFARIFLDFDGIQITALITKEASLELNLKVGEIVLWFVKSNEVMVEFKA
ncbi:TOBE domain-containing protein [Helicobacter sp. 23-1044]